MNRVVALLPLRGGSKSIPHKNVQPIGGRPLFEWVLEAAARCRGIDAVFVATDDDTIRRAVEALDWDRVQVIGRGPETATDTASTESVMLEFAERETFEHLVLIQATSPLLRAEDLEGGLKELERSGADSLLSVVEQRRFLWRRDEAGLATPVNYTPAARPRRQDFPPYCVENGAFYICRRSDLLRTRCRLSGRIAAYRMAEESYYELDEPSDWAIIESILQRDRSAGASSDFQAKARHIQLLLTDVDGVLTDAGMYYSEHGDELKKFNTRDGKGLELLRTAGLRTGILTAEDTKIVAARARKLKVDILYQAVGDKARRLEEILAETGLRADQVAYIGDDLNDVEIMRRVGLSACPADAMPAVKSVAQFRCHLAGGAGCVREFCDAILAARSKTGHPHA